MEIIVLLHILETCIGKVLSHVHLLSA